MSSYPIVNKNDQPASTAGQRQLPTFYMEDYSILGFRVSSCKKAVCILKENAFTLNLTEGCAAVEIQRAGGIHEVVQLLNAHGLACEIADVAEGMYQG